MTGDGKKSPLAIRNVRLFVAFRLFFNSRFYYPVFSILFLDFGLTLSQFAILNSVWAATIVLFEVPSGALADTFGRRNLLVFSGVLMVIEMTLLAAAPRGNSDILFLFFLVNRICSGVAEASASGADEALAYDSLKRFGNIDDWGQVLEKLMRFQSAGFIVAMISGAAVYDPAVIQKVADWVVPGMMTVTKETTLRFPIYLTLVLAFLTLGSTLMMTEVKDGRESKLEGIGRGDTVRSAFRLTLRAGKWILDTPFVFAVILTGLVFDGVIRMVITMSSQYYRMIQIPEGLFGVIGSVIAALGLIIPSLARRLAERRAPVFNLGVIAFLTIVGLSGMAFFIPYLGLAPALILFGNMYFVGFFMSHYLNRATDSSRRATVLSFKGLAFNLAYGLVGVLYSLLLAFLRSGVEDEFADLAGEALKNRVFMESMGWFPWFFMACLAVAAGFSYWRFRKVDGGNEEPAWKELDRK